ncbi:P-II family nitrogen regulator [Limnochorda pilosa]|uniref:Nitrogen regulatory protein P-II 1 n=1 Tax=Limnochorda pilosa TaxID=1555112 RepID=A0A0K2SQR8_LIMPI|nr:P-II family nitrogen regulator [Limnochorda pilosa]BAS29352.1 nitrogen regulatory protein P-II 1 [Limnochorda pilosa]
MKKLECIIRPSHFDAVKQALASLDVRGMTVVQVMGYGSQKGQTDVYRGVEFTVNLLPKVKIEVVLADEAVEAAIDAVTAAARTGQVGDGKIFVSDVAEAVRIRTGERGAAAV